MKKSLLSAVALTALVAFSGSAWAHIMIGVAGPITGPNAAFGAQLKNGAEQAAADINAAGGINGETDQACVRRRRLRSEAGHVGRQQVRRRRRQVRRRSLQLRRHHAGLRSLRRRTASSMITPSATNPKITERGLWNTFRTCGRDDQQGEVAGDYLAANFKDAKIAIIHDKTHLRPGSCRRDQEGAERRRRQPKSLYEGINIGDKDFSALDRQDEGSRRDGRLLGRPAHRRRPDHAPAAPTRA